MPFPFSCSPVIREWVWKKTQIEKNIFFKIKSASMCSCSPKLWILLTVSTCTAAVQNFQNPIYTVVFLLLTATCFFACVHDRHNRYDSINSHSTQILMYVTVNVKTMLLDFFYLRVSSYQLSSLPSDY